MLETSSDRSFPRGPYPWAVVSMLCVVATRAFIDRQLIYLFIEPVRAPMALPDGPNQR